MNDDLLNILLDNADSYASGEKISEILGISRAAVWKQINNLKQRGYKIAAINNKGYMITSLPDEICTARIEKLLQYQNNIIILDETNSTNAYAAMLAEQGAPSMTTVVASTQSGGRGRRGRSWVSPQGGIWMSVITRPVLEPSCVQAITLCAALAVIRGINSIYPINTKIKWPNDILIDNQKLCGILSEMSSEFDRVRHVVTGIGINVNFPANELGSDVNTTPVSLLDATGAITDRNVLIASILNNFENIYRQFEDAASFSPFLNDYISNMAWLDEQVTLSGTGEPITGIIKGIDDTGALLLFDNEEVKRIIAGEISVRRN